MDTKTRVLSTIEAMTSAFHQGDIEGIMRMFADFISAKAHFTFESHEVIAAGDIALHLTPWKMTGVAPDGSPITGAGLSVAVLRRRADGRWLMVIDNPFGDAILQRAAGRTPPDRAS